MTSSQRPSQSPGFPDEVPVADAVEQSRPVVDPAEEAAPDDLETLRAPMESDESDWQEQQQVVDDFDGDDFR